MILIIICLFMLFEISVGDDLNYYWSKDILKQLNNRLHAINASDISKIPFSDLISDYSNELSHLHVAEIMKSRSGIFIDAHTSKSYTTTCEHRNYSSCGYIPLSFLRYGLDSIISEGNIPKDITNTSNKVHLKELIAKGVVKYNDKDTLIIFSTCNQLNMTILSLDYLNKAMTSDMDLLIIDDYSQDSTISYLIKKGYAIITKTSAKGLTNSWNIGYHIANSLGYKYLMITNNDILIPKDALQIIKKELYNHVLVGPMTTKSGSGHNPLQVSLVQTKNENSFIFICRHFQLFIILLHIINLQMNISIIQEMYNRFKIIYPTYIQVIHSLINLIIQNITFNL